MLKLFYDILTFQGKYQIWSNSNISAFIMANNGNVERIPHHGPIDSQTASERLQDVGTLGAFLVRSSPHKVRSTIISFIDKGNRIKHICLPIKRNVHLIRDLDGDVSEVERICEKFEGLNIPVVPPRLNRPAKIVKKRSKTTCFVCECDVTSVKGSSKHDQY